MNHWLVLPTEEEAQTIADAVWAGMEAEIVEVLPNGALSRHPRATSAWAIPQQRATDGAWVLPCPPMRFMPAGVPCEPFDESWFPEPTES